MGATTRNPSFYILVESGTPPCQRTGSVWGSLRLWSRRGSLSVCAVVARGFGSLRRKLGTPTELVLERVLLAQRDRRDQIAQHRGELERMARAARRHRDVRSRGVAGDPE